MSRANQIRKKALEYAKQREWDKALREYIRLSELEDQNPNVFNELGDLHMKLGNKDEAFGAFHSAIDAYSRVSLFNNAVAVCKKIIRLNARGHTVYGKLARLRMQQGFHRDAETYAMTFLDKLVGDPSIAPEDMRSMLLELTRNVSHSAPVLDRAAALLLKWEFRKEAGDTLAALSKVYQDAGDSTKLEEVRSRMKDLGCLTSEQAEAPSAGGGEGAVGSQSGGMAAPGGKPANGVGDSSSAGKDMMYDFDAVSFDSPKPSVPADTGSAKMELPDIIVDLPAPGDRVAGAGTGDDQTPAAAPGEVWMPREDAPAGLEPGGDGDGEFVAVDDIVGQFSSEVTANIDAEDHRSHYDLGMAYLEMELIPEAIREFQLAAKSTVYQVRCLEMIGLCFIKQDQAGMAVKQLEKGLSLVGEEGRESLGLRYNLGLAREMLGDVDFAKASFEEVYMVDVTFRDVAEKVKKLTS